MNISTSNKKNIIVIAAIIVVVALGGWAVGAMSNEAESERIPQIAQEKSRQAAARQTQPSSGGDNAPEIQQVAGNTSASTPQQPSKPWRTRCSEEQQHCEIVQRLNVRESGKRFAEFAVGYPPERDIARGVLILPLGILLEDGVQIQVDDNSPFKVGVRYCAPQGCVAFMDVSSNLLQQMKSGNQAVITFKNAGGRTLNLPITLEGFTGAITGLQES